MNAWRKVENKRVRIVERHECRTGPPGLLLRRHTCCPGRGETGGRSLTGEEGVTETRRSERTRSARTQISGPQDVEEQPCEAQQVSLCLLFLSFASWSCWSIELESFWVRLAGRSLFVLDGSRESQQLYESSSDPTLSCGFIRHVKLKQTQPCSSSKPRSWLSSRKHQKPNSICFLTLSLLQPSAYHPFSTARF